jgi:hypothetical protein
VNAEKNKSIILPNYLSGDADLVFCCNYKERLLRKLKRKIRFIERKAEKFCELRY